MQRYASPLGKIALALAFCAGDLLGCAWADKPKQLERRTTQLAATRRETGGQQQQPQQQQHHRSPGELSLIDEALPCRRGRTHRTPITVGSSTLNNCPRWPLATTNSPFALSSNSSQFIIVPPGAIMLFACCCALFKPHLARGDPCQRRHGGRGGSMSCFNTAESPDHFFRYEAFLMMAPHRQRLFRTQEPSGTHGIFTTPAAATYQGCAVGRRQH